MNRAVPLTAWQCIRAGHRLATRLHAGRLNALWHPWRPHTTRQVIPVYGLCRRFRFIYWRRWYVAVSRVETVRVVGGAK